MKSLKNFVMESISDETLSRFNTNTIRDWSQETMESFLGYFDDEESAKSFYEKCPSDVQDAISEGVRDKAKKIGSKAWDFVKKTTGTDKNNI